MPIAFAAQPNLLLSLLALDGLKFYAGRSAYDSTWMSLWARIGSVSQVTQYQPTQQPLLLLLLRLAQASAGLIYSNLRRLTFSFFSLLSLRGYDGGGTRFLPPVR
jgi:hypothetical protein